MMHARPPARSPTRSRTGPPWRDHDELDENRQTASLAGLAVTLALLVGGLLLVRELHMHALLEDCLLAGRIACGMPPGP